jgi:hypothetical protein
MSSYIILGLILLAIFVCWVIVTEKRKTSSNIGHSQTKPANSKSPKDSKNTEKTKIDASLINNLGLIFTSFNRTNEVVPKDSALSKSLLGNVYQTTIPVALEYCAYDKCFYLTGWNDEPMLANPKQYDCFLKIGNPVKFEIVGLNRNFSLAGGYSLQVQIKLFDDIPFDNITDYLEADSVDQKSVKYIHKSFLPNTNPYLNNILDQTNKVVRTKDFVVRLSMYQFFNYKGDDIKNYSLINNKESLKKVTV